MHSWFRGKDAPVHQIPLLNLTNYDFSQAKIFTNSVTVKAFIECLLLQLLISSKKCAIILTFTSIDSGDNGLFHRVPALRRFQLTQAETISRHPANFVAA